MLSFNLENPASGTINVAEQLVNGYKMYTLNYPCSNTALCTPYTTTLPSGKYKFEVIDAGGGNGYDSSHPGGFGGFSIGYYELKSPITAFFFIGGKVSDASAYNGQFVNPPGGYNGGGNGGYDSYSSTNHKGGGGGGSSDIRISSKDLSKRIIVAGGGGGGCINANSAGNRGGSSGTPGQPYSTSKEGGAGTQSNGGSAYSSRGATAGSLFYGGQGSTNTKAYGGGGGGGGGLYGGGGGSSTQDHGNGYCASGGGGSGYIGGVQSSSQYSITASTSTHTNAGNGLIKITVFEAKLKNIDCFCSKDRNIYFCPLTSIHVLILFIRPMS